MNLSDHPESREVWDIYDAEGNCTNETALRGDRLPPGAYHLVVHIWIVNTAGQYLIQQREDYLHWMPGYWAVTGGSVVAGESKEIGARRELSEELRLEPEKLTLLFEYARDNALTSVWQCTVDCPVDEIDFCPDEVKAIRWASAEQIREMVREHRFINYGEDYFRNVFGESPALRERRENV